MGGLAVCGGDTGGNSGEAVQGVPDSARVSLGAAGHTEVSMDAVIEGPGQITRSQPWVNHAVECRLSAWVRQRVNAFGPANR